MNLHQGLLRAGIPSRMLTPDAPEIPDPSILPFNFPADSVERLRKFWRVSIDRRLRQRGRKQKTVEVAFSGATSIYGSGMDRHLPDAGIYHLHWVSEFVDYRILPRLQQRAPIVWTLHDMNPFTGGCHGSFDCKAYTSGCTDCPQLSVQNHLPQSFAQQTLNLKQRVFAELDPTRIRFVALSSWIQKEANRSVLLKDFETILSPNGVDYTVFCPLDKQEAKKQLGIPTDKTVILLCAASLDDKYKGIPYALEAIRKIPHSENLLVMTVGNGSVSQTLEAHGIQVIELGSLNNNAEMAKAYNAADIAVVSSIQDNFPSVVLEAMACELPVVAFATGGIPDMIRHRETGLLAPTGDVVQLTESIMALVQNPELRAPMGREARARVRKHFTPEQQTSKMADIYRELLQIP